MPDPKKVRADANALAAELLERLANEDVREIEVRRGGVRVRVSKDGAGSVVSPAPQPSGSVPVAATVAQAPASELPTVNAPLTGLFYRSPSPQTQPYVQIGSQVTQ
ncbi:MAG: hypothetical protein E6H94_01420, partial [Chloroflexi bacterium]